MILFFGTRPGTPTSTLLKGATCPYCNQLGTLNVLETPNYFHLFWIKLFKIGTMRMAECSHCKRVYFKGEFTPEMEKALERVHDHND